MLWAQFLLPLKRFPLHPQQEFWSGGWAAQPCVEEDCEGVLTSVEARSWMHIHAFLNGWCEGLLLNCHHLNEKKIQHANLAAHVIPCVDFSSRKKQFAHTLQDLKNVTSQEQGFSSPLVISCWNSGLTLTDRKVGQPWREAEVMF